MRFNTSITHLVLACIFALVSCTSEASKNKNYKILAFGDSLTAGYQLPASESFPAQLEQIMTQEGYKLKITNAGVSGDTSEQGLKRVDWALKQGSYDIVLLCLGANDGLRQLPVANMEKNLLQIIEKFEAAGTKVLLIGMELPSNLYRSYRSDFSEAYKKIAKKKNLPFLPFLLEGVAANPNLNLDDQIHPNAAGYKIIAQNVMKFLKANLD
ncbi:MAG: arylesterase [Bdellovibrionota bacterium]